ncbi:MAG: thioredoxin family protein [Verrucomicrobia bacterium]|nr:thioredoxin family protein [Verrucomicrobiota bacterium]
MSTLRQAESDELTPSQRQNLRRFALTVGAWGLAAAAAWWANRFWLKEAIGFLAPVILIAGAARIGLQDRMDIGIAGTLLKRGLAMFMVATGLWLWLPEEGEAKMPWLPYSDALVASAKKDGRPVMIDFSASWCEPCRRMERRVFSRLAVVAAAERFVVLKADMSDIRSEQVAKLAEQFGVLAYPTVVFLGSDGVERAALRLVGFERAQDFLKRLEAVQ